MPELVLTTEIAASPERCFALSLSVDAHTHSMKASGERIVAGVSSGSMTLGDTVTWHARHFGLPFRMTSKITAFNAPHRFVDQQVSGPFASWWHEHRFEGTDEHALMTDVVRYTSPVGRIGRLVDRVALERHMTRLLGQRNAWLKEQLERT